uniref:Variant surface glycoprotein n=1 Tax=Trypanosoma brucei TaxID=5691 RepID=Q581M4_9TRYP|nr:hypothetical protein, unlikely [Trypanosoma brucei]AAX80089.1 hypothetical protein, unlikely [Trypanosoma brucei]AAX80092.1 hypothetical protein, unlikely [Trypanosoma brucei]
MLVIVCSRFLSIAPLLQYHTTSCEMKSGEDFCKTKLKMLQCFEAEWTYT